MHIKSKQATTSLNNTNASADIFQPYLAILQKDLANPDLINPPKLSWVKLPSHYLKEKVFWKLVPQMWLQIFFKKKRKSMTSSSSSQRYQQQSYPQLNVEYSVIIQQVIISMLILTPLCSSSSSSITTPLLICLLSGQANVLISTQATAREYTLALVTWAE